MSEREFDGKDLDEALRAASKALGRPTAEFDYELLEGGRKGIFGLGARPVRIRIRENQTPLEAAVPKEFPKQATQGGVPGRPAPEGRAARGGSPRTAGRAARGGRPAPVRTSSPGVSGGDASAAGTLRRMLLLMDLELDVEEAARDGTLDLVLDGPDKKRLTARGGELLEALEFVLNRMGRRRWPDGPALRVVCRGFSSTKDDELVEMVREVAAQVASSGQPKLLQAMNPYERRVVHVTVRLCAGLTSTSEGDGFLKRVRVEKIAS